MKVEAVGIEGPVECFLKLHRPNYKDTLYLIAYHQRAANVNIIHGSGNQIVYQSPHYTLDEIKKKKSVWFFEQQVKQLEYTNNRDAATLLEKTMDTEGVKNHE